MPADKADPDQPTAAGELPTGDADLAPPAQPLPPGAIWLGTPGRDHLALAPVDGAAYELGPEIGGGGMGRVLIARDLRLGRVLAIKVMRKDSPEHLARFVNEARITARLQHPAIVNIHETGRLPDGRPFYAMKRVVGRPLSELIAESRSLDERLALLPRIQTVAEAVAYAHSEGVVHRDLKPQNVMVGDFGETVVLDWGIAKEVAAVELSGAAASAGLWPSETVVGSVLGTPAYMPPEQAAGFPVGPRADVYAIGAMLYHALSGEPPYRGRSSSGVVEQVKREPPMPIGRRVPELPPDLLAIIDKAMARQPEARYPTARELAEDLRRFETGQLVAVHRYSTWQLVRRWVGRHRAAVLVGAAALATLIATGTVAVAGIVRERDRASAAREVAQAQRGAAEELVDFMTTTLKERLDEVGRLDLLDGIADRVIGYYRRLGEHDALAAGQQSKRATALVILGDTERERGRLDAARLAYEEALRFEAARADAAPGDAALARTVSMTLGHLANLKMLQGDLDGALADYRRDLAIAGRLAALEPDNLDFQHDLALSWQTMGDTQLRRRDFEAAEASHRKALAILDTIVAQRPGVRAWELSRVHGWEGLGDLANTRGDEETAVAAYHRALALLAPIATAEPDNIVVRRNVSVLWNNIGEAERARGRLDEALAAYRKDLEIAVTLAARDADNQTYQRDLMVSRANVGDVLLAQGHGAEAAAIYAGARDATLARLAKEPTNTLWQTDLAELHGKVAEAEQARGRPDAAVEALRRAIAVRERLVAAEPRDPQGRLDLAAAWLQLAGASRQAGDRAGARAAATAALRLCEAFGPSDDAKLAELTARARAALADPPR